MSNTKHSTFEVDKAGLAKLLERRGKEFVLGELFQNAVDENVTSVKMRLELIGGGMAEMSVEDDNPEGFADLTHAYTLFAESNKKSDPTKRGRFNLGEKLVIALCREARISTTKGEIRFTPDGREMRPPIRSRGSKFEGIVPMTAEEFDRTVAFVHTLIVPQGVTATLNGLALPERKPLKTFTGKLRTEVSDDEGILRPTVRKTTLSIYPVREGEVAHLYELGIPVVEIGDKWHVDIGQKVPINLDRDNVPPAYLRDIRAYVLNNAHALLEAEDASAGWVTNALEHKEIDHDAVRTVVTQRFGPKAVINDPTDREGTKIAVSKGYTVVPGAALPKAAWANVKASEALQPAGVVTPSPNPNEGGEDLQLLEYAHAPLAVRQYVDATIALGRQVLGAEITVRLANNPQWPFRATYGGRQLTFNLGALGFRFFDVRDNETRAKRALSLVIHEFAHHYASDHLSREFYDACCNVGAAVALALATDVDLAARLGLGDQPETAAQHAASVIA